MDLSSLKRKIVVPLLVSNLFGVQGYIAISSSMPLNTIRHYAKAIENNNSIEMVLRGFVGGVETIKPTMDFIKSIKTIDNKFLKTPVSINGKVFKNYEITRVPCLIIDPKPPQNLTQPQRLTKTSTRPSYKKACGDFELEYLFKKLQ